VTWETYENPFFIEKSTRIYLKLQRRSNNRKVYHSPVVWCDFIKKDPSIHLTLNSKFSNQYAASGENALIDGIRGGKEYRTGDWQGYFGEDVVAEVKFDQPRNIEKLGLSCIRDQKSWIFLPSEIQIEISMDGVNFKKINPIKIPLVAETDANPEVFEFTTKNPFPLDVKAIRYSIKNSGVCPEWHLGNGKKTWMFIDELIFK
jgi:hypothetical protein